MSEIETCLPDTGLSIQQNGFGSWVFLTADGGACGLSARAEDDWLLLDTPLPLNSGRPSGRTLLAWNAVLAGTAKFAVSPATGAIRLRAEIPLEEEADVRALVCEAVAGFRQAGMLLGAEWLPCPEGSRSSGHAGEPAENSMISTLTDTAREAGWAFFERSPAKLAVELDGCRGSHQAILEEAHGGAISATVMLASWESASSESRAALAHLLLEAGGLVRLARPVLVEDEGRSHARLEVRSAHLRNPALLNRALSALSVACRLCGREAAVLIDAGIAGRFMAARGAAMD